MIVPQFVFLCMLGFLFPILNYIMVGGDILSVGIVIHVRELAFF
jgi:hypothetical protein